MPLSRNLGTLTSCNPLGQSRPVTGLLLDALISQIYFWNKTLHVSDSSSVHHQEFFNERGTHSNCICHTGLLTACELSSWHIPLLCVQWKTPDDGQRNCPKHVEFYSKRNFEKLVHLFGFIIRIYHNTSKAINLRVPKRLNEWLLTHV